ncbi:MULTISPECIES: 16S rRNA (adenine(1518)-N(6)/adenine(1519)-N(6))-dimethyltransferase RsmA [unclassified Lactobacillus]|uniref:16S rRNA (adenine(1518)-N(6)/adenine(1519)-N(6))- dimethyltransferase RsmA n=1 Tax=unclassified Lactobacillus TaxID=2620435 RepID=UPI000EFAD1AE|nr:MULTISPECIES: 16S rRNA (adenine(1518)-N(6)/adenine(1519)-N(6))-dimethyltransferase RsmA [unclassified Lactobacillus]RMC23662.1 16S rRNA (adenine(1518)-N(6)/adenine(1519)-N(6))-dimethyltransferase RsmA [Lactobacillus sp. ESL0247]RMC27422.1 16S rRNA (adenine(1518)-N(6)/adenine(1519)-N(6))-dimethyltransferase RsmA [Lactobacillus sp. ESL0246]RMC30623.1 16S rRNA (adenine(1518)-N(6)/adenine(1519)-N(6))-dimethyltransferase RsmA [Lactobacillus sp. ESL0245]RMC47665.1 16S rRNA (adenine(1518)-N(6)/aden
MNNEMPIGSMVRTQAIINRYFVRAKKNLGQNFLIDLNAIQGIVQAAEIGQDDQVIEIGPGIGSLTEQLLLAGAKVFAYEVDDSLPEILHNELPIKVNGVALNDRFRLLMKDILQADFKHDLEGFFDLSKPIKVVANLPYYITTPIIFFLNKAMNFSSLTLMMQKEVAERLQAKPNNKDYGPLTIGVQTEMSIKIALTVKSSSFIPQPKVDSSVVILKPLEQKIAVGDPEYFNWIVKMCFGQRRKTLNNNLKNILPDPDSRKQLLAKLHLDPRVRPEQLAISQFVMLAQAIKSKR